MRNVTALVARPFFAKTFECEVAVFTSLDAYIPAAKTEEYMQRAGEYAKSHATYVVPPLYEEEDGHLALCILDRHGQVLGSQQGIFLQPLYDGFAPGERVTLVDTPFGKVYLCVDSDVFHPECARVAAMAGAEIMVCSQHYGRGAFSRKSVLNGPFAAAQANNLYAVCASNVEGCIIAPCSDKNQNGFLMQPGTPPLYARLSAAYRERVAQQRPILGGLNAALIRANYERI